LAEFPEQRYREQFATRTVRLAKVMSEEDVATYETAFNRDGVATVALSYYRSLVHDMPGRRHVEPARIRCPVRVLWGSRDVALPAVVNEIAAPWIDDFDLHYFPRCWHWLASERARAVSRHLQ